MTKRKNRARKRKRSRRSATATTASVSAAATTVVVNPTIEARREDARDDMDGLTGAWLGQRLAKPKPKPSSGPKQEPVNTEKSDVDSAGRSTKLPALDAPSRALAASLSAFSSKRKPTATPCDRGTNRLKNDTASEESLPPRHSFRKSGLLSEVQVHAIETLHRNFSTTASTKLSAMAGARTVVELTDVQQCTYFDFIRSLGNPTCLHLVYFGSTRVPFVTEMSLNGLYPLIDRLVGGAGEDSAYPLRPLTHLEQPLARFVLTRLLEELRQAWGGLPHAHFEVGESEHNPLLMQVFDAKDTVIVLSLQLTLGQSGGTFQLCLPTIAFHETLVALADSTTLRPRESSICAMDRRANLLEQLGQTNVTLHADLGSLPIRLQDLATLQPGDIIDTQISRQAEINVRLDGRAVFRGRAVQRAGRRAIETVGLQT